MSERDAHEYAVWSAEWTGGLSSRITGRGHEMRADEPPQFGGEDTGPMPTEFLVAALASCFCIAVVWAAGKRRIPIDDLRVDVRPERAGDEPRHGAYDVWIHSSTPAEALAPAIDLAKRYCWVTNTISHPPEVRYHVGEGLG